MPLHDHPNMCVFFRMLFGKLDYRSYDKLDEKFRYNDFSFDEYHELLEKSNPIPLTCILDRRIPAQQVTNGTLEGENLLLVRPSAHNMHEFVALENTCFFDICLPNYTADGLRRITYFKEIGEADPTGPQSVKEIEYYTTPPKFPANFEVEELSYRGRLD